MYFNYVSKDLQHVHRLYWRTTGNIIVLGGRLGLSSVFLCCSNTTYILYVTFSIKNIVLSLHIHCDG